MSRFILFSMVFLSSVVNAAEFRTPWGTPDLRGIWTTATLTPLERPADKSNQATLSSSEQQQLEDAAEARWA